LEVLESISSFTNKSSLILNFFLNIKGQTGLLLGVSLLSIIEIVEVFIEIAFVMAKRRVT
jgi:hypothetical protein